MLLRKVAFIGGVGCIAPILANATMVYTPSRPCGCVAGCNATYNAGSCGCVQNNYANNTEFRNFQRVSAQSTQESLDTGPRDWYLAANVAMNFWSWENEYNSNYGGTDLLFNKDEYSFESVFGGALAIGTRFSSGIRGDVELGFSSEFSDSDDLAEYKLSVPYLMANAYWDFESGMYFGGGLGVARPTVNLSGAMFDGGNAEKKSWSPKVGFALGYATAIADNTFIDFKYRISLMKGADMSRTFLWEQVPGSGASQYVLQVENDLILENALSVGIRFSF